MPWLKHMVQQLAQGCRRPTRFLCSHASQKYGARGRDKESCWGPSATERLIPCFPGICPPPARWYTCPHTRGEEQRPFSVAGSQVVRAGGGTDSLVGACSWPEQQPPGPQGLEQSSWQLMLSGLALCGSFLSAYPKGCGVSDPLTPSLPILNFFFFETH